MYLRGRAWILDSYFSPCVLISASKIRLKVRKKFLVSRIIKL